MRKNFLSFALAGVVSASAALSASAQSWEESPQVHRPFYGYFLNNDNFESLHWGIALQYFDDSEQSDLLYDYGTGNRYGVYAGTGIDGMLYLCEYEYISSLEQPQPRSMVSYNTFTGRREEIGAWAPTDSQFKPTDMTYDYLSEKMYALGYDNGVNGLYEVNPETAEFTKLCTINQGVTLAAAPDGQLYTIDSDGWLYRLNKETGALVKVFNTGYTGMMNMQTMEFDRTNGKLYWASNCTSRDNSNVWLQEIDLSNPDNVKMIEVGAIGKNAYFVGMYIPAASSFEAPAAPTDMKVVTENPDVLSATIYWSNPTTDFAGKDIDTLNGVVLFRNGEQIKFFTGVKPGEKMEFTDDKAPADGEYRYDIMAFNDKGDGMKGTVYGYVGHDAPGAPSDIKVSVDDNFLGATISWTAPTVGKHDGAFKADEVKYNVIRRPDNLTVKEGVTGTSVRDENFRRLLNYYYDVEAVNEIGSSTAASAGNLIGPAMEDLDEYFEDYNAIPNKWITVDANDDSFTWIFYTTVSHDVFGDYETAAQYILTPTSIDSRLKDADDWLISGPLKFDADKEYELVVRARCYADAPQMIELCYGNTTDYTAMKKIGEAEVTVNDNDPTTGTMALVDYVAAIPAGETFGCVGLHLISPVPMSKTCFLQVANVKVREKGTGAVEGIEADAEVAVSVSGKVLSIAGEFGKAALYTVDGRKVADINSASTDLSAFAAGVYVVTVDNKSVKFVL